MIYSFDNVNRNETEIATPAQKILYN